jgi:hypothetical protein
MARGRGKSAAKDTPATRSDGRSAVAAARGGRPSAWTVTAIVVVVAFVAVLVVYFLTRTSSHPPGMWECRKGRTRSLTWPAIM